MSAPDILGRAELAQLLGVSSRQAHRIAARPDFPEAAKLTAGRVWERADVEAWIRKHRA